MKVWSRLEPLATAEEATEYETQMARGSRVSSPNDRQSDIFGQFRENWRIYPI